MVKGVFCYGILGKALERGVVDIRVHNFRDRARDRHRTVDDYPYGGGAGMVLRPEPIFETVEAAIEEVEREMTEPVSRRVVLLTPQGCTFTQKMAQELAGLDHLVLICGRYEGVDERVREHLATDEVSIGDYVLSGGEVAAMVIVDAVVRLIPGVLGSAEAARDDSFADGLLQFPQYTRPAVYRGWAVPEVLLSGNHQEVARWRRKQSMERTSKRRPDLLMKGCILFSEGDTAGSTIS
jgi:tRNA (guanine37-N1)-methyltransferase